MPAERAFYRRPPVLIGTGIGVLLVTGAVLLAIAAGSDADEPDTPVATGDAGDAALALAALPEDPAAYLSDDARADSVDPQAAIPPGTTITPEPETWSPDGLGGGTMGAVVTLPDGTATEYLVLMVLEDGEWKVSATLEVDAGDDDE